MMFKGAFRFNALIIFALLMLASPSIFSDETSGSTDSGVQFSIETHVSPSAPNEDGVWGSAHLSYRSGKNETPISYSVPVQAPPFIRVNGFGLVTISEKIGGMDGVYKVTYVKPTDSGLIAIGAVELSQSNGKYVDATDVIPLSITLASRVELKQLMQHVAQNIDALNNPDKAKALDSVLLFFVVKDLIKEVGERNPMFVKDFVKYVNEEIDPSIANLLRRKIIGGNISLCDEDQFDVFVCKIKDKVLSICYGATDFSSVLEYRVGSKRRMELSLKKSVDNKLEEQYLPIVFDNGIYGYIVELGGSEWVGVKIVKNDSEISEEKCSDQSMESYMVPEGW